MATLKLRRGSWYARVFWHKNGKKKEKQIPLRTPNKIIARERLAEIKKVEVDIKKEMKFSFPWLSNQTQVTVKRFKLKQAVEEWLTKRKKNGIRLSTLKINQYSTDYLMDCLGYTYPLNAVNTLEIERFIDNLKNKGLNETSINIHLRTVKAMFRYYKSLGRLEIMPMIQQLSVGKAEPIYITDEEFSKLQKLESLDGFYKRVFLLYRDTGMRLREPLIATLNGDWIDVSIDSKSHSSRSIPVDDKLASIFSELQTWLNVGHGSTLKDVGDHLSKKFRWALNTAGVGKDKHFHSLRHTYAVRSLLKGISIYEVKLLMGHASVVTTEVYSNMNLKRVAQDFPLLEGNEEVDTDIVDTPPKRKRYPMQYEKIQA